MPQHAPADHVTDHVTGAVVKSPPSADPATATAPPATTTTNTASDEPVAEAAGDVAMETAMTTSADVQVHEPQQQRNNGSARHVRLTTATHTYKLVSAPQPSFSCRNFLSSSVRFAHRVMF